MIKFLSSCAVLALLASPIVAKADTIITYDIVSGTLNTFSGTLGEAGPANQVGTVSGTFQFDETTKTFQDINLTYVYNGTPETFTTAASTASTYNGEPFYIAFNTGNSGTTAALELDYGLNLCTLNAPCPGINASNYEQGNTNIGTATVTSSITSTPEPSSLVLLGTGILGLAGAARRKFRKA